ncbi:hypothetical protein GN958_ATG00021 [Phytophthora infestans]|uniref:Uncharacterized protein n=1 Tax=Phytophthora infestans TaxID=4787 RepID=A0A8S9VJC7_PHYIN|nr:hypothetical protein GN958_ATG00021 [Phytophthora infestans]
MSYGSAHSIITRALQRNVDETEETDASKPQEEAYLYVSGGKPEKWIAGGFENDQCKLDTPFLRGKRNQRI